MYGYILPIIIWLYVVSELKELSVAPFSRLPHYPTPSCLYSWASHFNLLTFSTTIYTKIIKRMLSPLGNTRRINITYLNKDFYSAFV